MSDYAVKFVGLGSGISPDEVNVTEATARLRALLRYVMPWDAPSTVITDGDPRWLDLHGMPASHFFSNASGTSLGPFPFLGSELIRRLEAARARGARFLVVPRPYMWWLTHYSDFGAYLASRYRLVLREPQTALVYALTDVHDVAFREQGAPDGLPLPPPELIEVTIAAGGSAWEYVQGGLQAVSDLRAVLEMARVTLDDGSRVLDFGCGCGRILRQVASEYDVSAVGCDYNPFLIAWCAKNLPIATFVVNDLKPPTQFEDGQFDFVYAFSVFTHLSQDDQLMWRDELRRILAPGGHLFLSTHGASRVSNLTAEERAAFSAGEIVVRNPELQGSNACSSYHPPKYLRDVLADGFRVEVYVPDGARSVRQDATLLTKV